jgi:hypothetical protein
MKNRLSSFTAGWIGVMIIMLMSATSGLAANFTLAWDPNCNEDPTLIGYSVYYNAGSSVLADPDGADIVFISLSDPDFDPDQPSYNLTGLQDDIEYFFTVSAVYEDGESAMSNEISGIRNSTDATPDSNPPSESNLTPNPSSTPGTGSSGGCFISSLN